MARVTTVATLTPIACSQRASTSSGSDDARSSPAQARYHEHRKAAQQHRSPAELVAEHALDRLEQPRPSR